MRTTPLSSLIGGISGLVLGTLCKYRILPFLRPDTMVSGGRSISTADFAANISNLFYLFGAFSLILCIVLFLKLRAKQSKA
jgi:hypothetical protein